MSPNPELRRNLWLEATPARLALMPVILGGVFFLAYVADDRRLGPATAGTALAFLALLTWLWGAHLASESVLAELRSRTWDWQRMSDLGAWTLGWGKLAGATAYPWYGGIICLAVYGLAEPEPGTRQAAVGALFVLGGVLAQAAAMFAALHVVSRDRVVSRGQSSAYLALGALVLYPLSMAASSARQVAWYGARIPTLDFTVATLAAFAAFAVVGVWVRVRRELRVRTLPVVWAAFVTFAAAWGAGFAEPEAGRPGGGWLVGFLVAVGLTWLTALADRKDPVALRRVTRAARERRWRRLAEELPPWLVALPFALAGWALLIASPGRAPVIRDAGQLRWMATAILLFLVRDLALLLHLNLGARPRRADLFAVVLLAAGYVLVPLVLSATELEPAAALFYPQPERAAWSAAGALAQLGVVGWLLARRWRARERVVAGEAG